MASSVAKTAPYFLVELTGTTYQNNPKFNKHTEREVVIWQDRRRKQKIKPSDRA